MAIVKLQSPIAGLRGKYGGMIFSENGSSPYVKQWSPPVAKRTAPQVSQRARMATIQHGWSSLAQGDIDDWNALAAAPPEIDTNSLKKTYLLSGSAWHMRVNLRRLQAGQAIDNICPANVAVNPPLTFAITSYEFAYGARTDTFDYTDGDFTGFYAVCHISCAQSLVKQVQTTNFMSIWCGAVEQDTWTEITEELAGAFGWLAVGNKLFGRLWKQSTTGIRSVPIETSSLVLAEP